MKNRLQHITLYHYQLQSGKIQEVLLSYEIFGRDLHTAPIILINHALTGNSNVAGNTGWWKTLVAENKVIDLSVFTVICFNIPGNGYDGFFWEQPQEITIVDVAHLFLLGLQRLKINSIFAIIAGSIGGSIAWEMLIIQPNLTQIFIPIATDYKTSDWLFAQCVVQEFLLQSAEKPLEKSRIHAMLCYRTPESINSRFDKNLTENKSKLKSQDWLEYHGKSLHERYTLDSYKLMNQLLKSGNRKLEDLVPIQADIHLISINSDLFYPESEIVKTYQFLKNENKNVQHHQINSIHGHDAFLMEYQQLNNILQPILHDKK